MEWIIAAAVAAVGAIVSSVIGGQSAGEIATRQNIANLELWQKNIQENKRATEEERAYNSPLQQRKRLEDAGINPYIALSGAPTATRAYQVGYIPEMKPVPTGLSNMLSNIMPILQQAVSTGIQTRNYGLERKKLEYELELAQAHVIEKYVDIENKIKLGELTEIRKEIEEIQKEINERKIKYGGGESPIGKTINDVLSTIDKLIDKLEKTPYPTPLYKTTPTPTPSPTLSNY